MEMTVDKEIILQIQHNTINTANIVESDKQKAILCFVFWG